MEFILGAFFLRRQPGLERDGLALAQLGRGDLLRIVFALEGLGVEGENEERVGLGS